MTEGARAAAMAATALAYWGGAEAGPRLVKWRENIVFDAVLRDGRRVALRLHRPGYQSRGAIEAELVWTGRLAAAGLLVPPPVATVKGRLTARAGERVASVVGWIEGEPLGAAERRLDGSAAEQGRMMEEVGALIARLHGATDALALPASFDRPRWDAAGYLGGRPRWGPFWANPAFSGEERALIEAARREARAALAGCGDEDFGLIHADVLRENILRTGAGLALIDFDDSGWGWRLYDLATAVVQSLEEPALAEIVAGVVAGYRAARVFSPASEARLPLFVMLRTFASAGWIATRGAPDDPRQRFYAERAVRMARAFLSGRAPWEG